MKAMRVLMVACAFGILGGCGGGGGGGPTPNPGPVTGSPNSPNNPSNPNNPTDPGTPTEDPLTVTLDKSDVAMEAYEGSDTFSGAVVTATIAGTYSGEVYVRVFVLGQGVLPNMPIAVTSTWAEVVLLPNVSLAPGVYTGSVVASVCADPDCVTRIGGPPKTINFTTTILRGARTSVNTVYLAATEGSAATSSEVIVTPAERQTSFSVALADFAPWVQITDITPNSFKVVAGPRPPGTDAAVINVRSGESVARVVVSFTSRYAAGHGQGIYASPRALAFNLLPNMQSSQPISVTSPYSITRAIVTHVSPTTPEWLTVTGSPPTFIASVSTNGLSEGQYTAVVHFDREMTNDRLEMVEVVLNVSPTLTFTAVPEFVVSSDTSLAALAGSSTIGFLGDAASEWTATTQTPWLALTRATGATGTQLQFSIPSAQLQALDNFETHEGSVRITSNRTGVTAIDVPVKLTKRLAEVTGLGPQIQFAGRTLRVVVRGRGFEGLNLQNRLSMSATVTGRQPINDRAFVVNANALAQGQYSVGVTHAVGFPASTQTLHVLTATTPAYAVVPSDASVRSLFVDPRRATVYGVRIAPQQELARYRLQAGVWSEQTARSFPQLHNAGLSNDANRLYVTTSPGRLSFYDIDNSGTLNFISQFDREGGLYHPYNLYGVQGPITVSSDNRIWLAGESGAPTVGKLTYFDIASSQFHDVVPTSFYTNFNHSPVISVGRDGMKLIVDQSQSTPERVLTMSTATDELVERRLEYNCYGTLSDDGSRALCGFTVYDGDMNAYADVGIANDDRDDGWIESVLARVVSPSGRFAYVYAFHAQDFNFNSSGLGSEPVPTHRPRVYVFDLSSETAPGIIESTTFFEFDGLHFPSCRTFYGSCSIMVAATIAPDGNTLYFMGDRNLVVVPIPAQYRN
jgi:hypothetical protein